MRQVHAHQLLLKVTHGGFCCGLQACTDNFDTKVQHL